MSTKNGSTTQIALGPAPPPSAARRLLSSLVLAFPLMAISGSEHHASATPAGSLTPDSEIKQATFVGLDFNKFPKLPPSQVPPTQTIFVSTHGNDAAAGTIEYPRRTIVSAVRAASSASTIVIRGGTYTEAWEPGDYRALVLNQDDLTLMAYPGETVSITPATGITFGIVVNAQNLVLRGINLYGFPEVGILFEGGPKKNRNVVIADLEITGSDEAIAMWEPAGSVDELLLANLKTDAIIHCGVGPCSSWRLENVTIDAGGNGWGADAFAIESGDNILLINTTVLGAGSDGIDTKATRVVVINSRVEGAQNNAIKLWHGGDVINTLIRRGWQNPIVVEEGRFRLLNSTIAFTPELASHHDYSMILGYDKRQPMQVEIINSIIANPSGGAWINPESSWISIRNNLFYTADGSQTLVHGNFAANYTDGAAGINQTYGSENLTADPLLDTDLRPAASSPAVDAGVALSLAFPVHDVEGRTRIAGAAPDIGAYEFAGLTIPDPGPPIAESVPPGGEAISGSKLPAIPDPPGAQPVNPTLDLLDDTNILGGDLSLALPTNLGGLLSPEVCAKACKTFAKCKAFTYVKPSANTEAACHLKGSVPKSQQLKHDPCCVSGIKLASTPAPPSAPSPTGPEKGGGTAAVGSVLTQNFDSAGLDGSWWFIGSGMQIQNKRLTCQKGPEDSGTAAVWDIPPTESYTLNLEYTHGSGIGAVVLNASGDPPRPHYRVWFSDDRLEVVRGVGTSELSVKAAAEYGFLYGQTYPLSITVTGGHLSVAVGNQPLLDWIDPEPLPPGALAFGCGIGTGFAFDNVTVAPTSTVGPAADSHTAEKGLKGLLEDALIGLAEDALEEVLPGHGEKGSSAAPTSGGQPAAQGPEDAATWQGPSSASLEFDTIRIGSDYDSSYLPSADPQLCRQACLAAPSCRAFTYVQPGARGSGSKPECWLKDAVPPPQPSTCCVSGVKSGS